MTRSNTISNQNVATTRKQATRNWCRRIRRTPACLVKVLLAVLLVTQSNGPMTIEADDAAGAASIDMGTLANLASNIGSNPQLMNLVTNFLSSSGGAGAVKGLSAGLEQDQASVQQEVAGNEPLRRGTRLAQSESQAAGPQQAQQPPQQPQQPQQQTASAAASSQGSSLAGLMTMLPGMLGAGGGGGGGGGAGLASLLGNLAKTPATSSALSGTDPQQASASAQMSASGSAQVQVQQPANLGPAQTVINQVLAAYVSRQIPDELIQLALSGRVPPQLIELALSGQVPPQLIQMIITGQVPMPVINAFLNAMQTGGGASGASTGYRAPTISSMQQQQQQQAPSPPGVFSTTRALFEAIFKRDANGRPMIAVPTLLGTIPIKVPSLPNVRSFGQMVGGTISNVASIF